MPRPILEKEECTACGACTEVCPNNVLEIVGTSVDIVNGDECTGCEACIEECPMGVITSIDEED